MNLNWFFCKGCRPYIILHQAGKKFNASKFKCELGPCPNCEYFIKDIKEKDKKYHIYCRRKVL